MPQGTPRTATQIDVALLAVGIPTVEARTGRQHRRGRGFEAQPVVPARRIRLQNSFRTSLRFECRKADRAASSWQITSSSSQDAKGELVRVNPTRGAKEGISDRGKPLSSRGAGEAISILRAPRKLSCNGGSVTRRVTGCQRRSRVRSETTSLFPGARNPGEGHAPANTRPRCRTARRSGSSAS